MPAVISVENLSKKFSLKHRQGGGAYSTFRDALAGSFKQLAVSMLPGRRRLSEESGDEEFWAVRDISFEIRQGEKVGIIGRNGAGKSTLLKLLSRIIEPTEGRFRLRGRVASLLEVGTGFHPELTGRENIFFNGAVLGMTQAEIKRRFDAIVDFAEVEKFLDTPVKHYSSGMYVRLGFAVAAHLEPDILIVDEVLAVGDAQFQKKCLAKLQDMGAQGRTIVFVSHNMSSVLQFTERALVLNQGRLLRDSDSESCVMEYLRLNDNNGKASDLKARVSWLTIGHFGFDHKRMELGFNKPLRFALEITLEQPVKELTLVMSLVNTIGARLITAKAFLADLAPGEHHIGLAIPDHRLIPGSYFVGLTLLSKGSLLFDKEQLISIELLADEIDDPLLMPHIRRGKDKLGCYCPIDLTHQVL